MCSQMGVKEIMYVGVLVWSVCFVSLCIEGMSVCVEGLLVCVEGMVCFVSCLVCIPGYVWFLSRKVRNKRMHSYNGNVKGIQCPICEKTFKDTAGLKRHEASDIHCFQSKKSTNDTLFNYFKRKPKKKKKQPKKDDIRSFFKKRPKKKEKMAQDLPKSPANDHPLKEILDSQKDEVVENLLDKLGAIRKCGNMTVPPKNPPAAG